jgi:hypothetical protein
MLSVFRWTYIPLCKNYQAYPISISLSILDTYFNKISGYVLHYPEDWGLEVLRNVGN